MNWQPATRNPQLVTGNRQLKLNKRHTMGKEIERKFLLKTNKWKLKAEGRTRIKQGYLNTHKERTVRVRVRGNKAFLTIKGKTVGATRLEYEYPIPVAHALDLLELCERPIIEKARYLVKIGKLTWEVDVFSGDNEGLALAEIELEREDQKISIPRWIGKEVTGDPRYYNSSLVKTPFKDW